MGARRRWRTAARAAVDGQKTARTPRFVTIKDDARALDEANLARARRLVGLWLDAPPVVAPMGGTCSPDALLAAH